jgi:very-short-patch-repair endonuclease
VEIYLTIPAPPSKGGDFSLRRFFHEGLVINLPARILPFSRGDVRGVKLIPKTAKMDDKGKIFNPKRTKAKRKYLRNNMTKTEVILWSKLKGRQLANIKFRRQHGIGKYVVDFYAPEYKLIVEVDGESHYTIQGQQHDYEKNNYLENFDLKIIRFTNDEVKNHLDGVLEMIKETLESIRSV